MTLHNIYHYVNQDVAKISSSLFLTIILIKNIHLSVAGQTIEVSIKKYHILLVHHAINFNNKSTVFFISMVNLLGWIFLEENYNQNLER